MQPNKLTISSIVENSGKSMVLFALLSLIFFIGLGHVHLFDWDEINFAESAREMIESGDYLHVQINYMPFWEKPPFFIWLQVLSMKVFGINEFAARFPNAVFGFLYLISLYLIGKKHYSAKFGFTWAILFFASLLPHIYFKSGIIDPVFNFFIFLSIYFMIRTISRQENEKLIQTALLSGVFSGLSVLTKGPVGFLILALTLFVYLLIKRFRNFPSITSILLFFTGLSSVISIWLIFEVAQNGLDVLGQFIAYQAELFSSGVAGHEQPFYYHFVVVFFGCFPISILALPSFGKTRSDFHLWMKILFWVVIILFSIVTTKIVHYSSMTYVPLAFLAALTVTKSAVKNYVKWLFLIIGILIGIVITAVPLIILNKEALYPLMNDPFAVASLKYAQAWSGIEVVAGILFISMVVVSFFFLIKERAYSFLTSLAINMSVTMLLILFMILPKIEKITQGPMIEFCEGISDKDCYVDVYDFKSYAHYFYCKTPYDTVALHKDQQWLLNGPIDKDVYIISKITNNSLDTNPNMKQIGIRGGFIIYKRTSKNSEE